jgi:lycopene beta-cyclase
MNKPIQYDYIIAGSGCAGLSLAVQLQKSSVPFNKILLIDKDLKNKNDRTWCFWTDKKNNWFDAIVFKQWNTFAFKSNRFEKKMNINPFSYLMIKGIDFYTHCLSELKNDPRFDIKTETIQSLYSENGKGILETNLGTYFAPLVFNSAIRTQEKKNKHINYVQHFKGWVVEANQEVFDPDCPTFMDFRIEQENDCRFVYIIPFSKTKALVEYTGFSSKALKMDEYDKHLQSYLKNYLNLLEYKIEETEYGEIPMAESEFINPFGKNVMNIGTAGGFSKPSTGYTFYFIQKNISHLISQLEKVNQNIIVPTRKLKFYNYDRIFLDVMNGKKVEFRDVFTALFKNNRIQTLLSFLNEETSIREDLRIMNSVPKRYFIPSAIKKYFSK